MNIYERAAEIALNYIKSWLPDGEEENGQWSATNPLRNDTHKGSFKINLTTGAFNDYADDTMVGKDAVTLYAKLNGLSNYEAAKEILDKYDSSYFPGAYGKEDKKEEWRQLSHPIKNAPELPYQHNEIARWPLEVKKGDEWLPVMWVVRLKKSDGKVDYPYTLFSNAKNYEWRCKALRGMHYPLYNARSLEEKPNARVLLVEGQKVAGVLKDILTTWAVVGWYGGAPSVGLSDLAPLTGREVYFSFDADTPGRQAIERIKKLLPDTKINLVYPPHDVEQGWDLADAVNEGWDAEKLESHILSGQKLLAVAKNKLPEEEHLAPCLSPIRFTPITEEEKFFLRDLIIEEKPSGVNRQTGTIINKTVLRDNWIGLWVENDRQLLNSIMQDYTTGLKKTAYDSKSEWLGAVEHRADELEIPQSSLTESALKKIERAIELKGRKYNQVVDYMDTLAKLYPDSGEECLDKFMQIFKFDITRYQNEPIEEYEKRELLAYECYKELWHKFFLKMHGHINGTRRHEDGSYYGLMENDIVPILAGGQGIGKTTLARYIALDDNFYTDLGSGLKGKFGDADTFKKIRGKLLVEIGEMKIMKNPDDVGQVKSFISKTTAMVDIKYVEQQYQTPLTCSYIGTSNPRQYLSDETGNRRWCPVKLKDIDKNFMSSEEGQRLIRELHSYYNRITQKMTTKQVRKMVEFSPELAKFMEELTEEALITYSDYEACCKVINMWMWGDSVAQMAPAPEGAELLQADVERLAFERGYRMRITQKSCLKAMADCGLTLVAKMENGKLKNVWIKPEKKSEQTPF